MGLMTLLSRKIYPEKNRQLRAPPYERQVTSRSPVRRVNEPLSLVNSNDSNNSNSRASMPRSSGAGESLKASRSSTSHVSPGIIPTSSPVPFSTGLSTLDRPSTANPAMGQNGLRSDARVTARPMSRSGNRFSLIPRITSPRPMSPALSLAPPPPPPSRHVRQSSVGSHCTATLHTLGGRKAYVDLLDAQSAFSPSDFYSRVQASGARNYGEDVADRNIAAGAMESDARSTRASTIRRPFSSMSYCSPTYEEEEEEEDNGLHEDVMMQTSIDAALWSQSISVPEQTSEAPQTPTMERPGSLPKLQRQSLNARPKSSSSQRRSTLTGNTGNPSLQISVSKAQSTSLSGGLSPALPSPRYSRSIPSLGRRSPSLSVSSKTSPIIETPEEETTPEPQLYINDKPIVSPQPTSFRMSAFTDETILRPPTRHSTHSVGIPSHNTVPDLSSLADQLNTDKVPAFKAEWLDDGSDRDSAPSPSINMLRSRRESTEEYPQIRGVVSPTRARSRAGMSDIDNHVPLRSSSMRHSSMSSATPTTCSSSTMFQRPQSQHTADTSVDLNTRTVSSLINSSVTSVSTFGGGQTALETIHKEKNSATEAEPTIKRFNMDDYISDDDSFITTKHRTPDESEDLLFNSGYGANGMQLPGLEEAFAAPSPVIKFKSPRLSKQSYPDDLRQAYREISTDLDVDQDKDDMFSAFVSRPWTSVGLQQEAAEKMQMDNKKEKKERRRSALDMLSLDDDDLETAEFENRYTTSRKARGSRRRSRGAGELLETTRVLAIVDSLSNGHVEETRVSKMKAEPTVPKVEYSEPTTTMTMTTALELAARMRKEARARKRASLIGVTVETSSTTTTSRRAEADNEPVVTRQRGHTVSV